MQSALSLYNNPFGTAKGKRLKLLDILSIILVHFV